MAFSLLFIKYTLKNHIKRNFMNNCECRVCGEKIINPMQKEIKKRIFCSEDCENIPSIFQLLTNNNCLTDKQKSFL